MMAIRAIGAPTSGTGAVAGAYLDYLTSGIEMKGAVRVPSLDGTISYYDAGIEGPGMWHGHGATHLGLAGFVDPQDLHLILQGRHHETGERLLSAAGSSGRHSLKVGQATRNHDGQPVWSMHDLAIHLHITEVELRDLVDTLGVSPLSLDDGNYFAFSDVAALGDVLDISDKATRLDSISDVERVSTGRAAEALGVSRRYITMAIAQAKTYDTSDTPIGDRELAWLPAERNDPTNPKSQWKIMGEDLKAFDERREPPAVRLAYDVTFTFEKSISVVGLLADGDTRDAFTQAITTANRTALDHLDRYGSNGRERQRPIGSEGLTVASFMHATSRNNDPFLHVHNLVVNSIEDANGQGRALDARGLYLEGPTASALGSIQLRWELSNKLGLQWEATSNSVEIAGVHPDVIDGFSTGRKRIESIVDEAGIDLANPSARQRAATNSRPDKSAVTPDSLTEQWWDRAVDLGFGRDTLTTLLANRHELPTAELSIDESQALRQHLAGWDGATRNASVFTRADVLRAIGEWSPDGHNVRVMPAHVADRAATDFLTSRLVVPLDIDKQHVAKLVGKVSPALQQRDVFTTQRVLDTHQLIDTLWADGLTADVARVGHEQLRTAINDAPTLSGAQADLVTQWTTSGHQFQSAVGVPGAGKTFAVAAAARAWEAEGFEVIGAAVSGHAAQTLANEARIDTNTIASYLAQIYERGESPLHARSVLIVDEAGTLGDKNLESLMRAATASGAAVRFLGDPAQHASVEAGGMWHHLTESYAANTPALLHSYRFQDSPVDVQANQLARDGQIKDAFDLLRDHGQLTEVGSRDEALGAMLRRSIDARDAGTPAPMIDWTNANRVILNGAMQHVRVQRGEVTDLTQFGIRHYGIGDEIISRAPNWKLAPAGNPDAYLRNGSAGVITNIDYPHRANVAPVVTADFGDGPIAISGELFAGDTFDLGYAVTSHAVQGATLPLSHSSVAAGATSAEYVVNLSRGRRDNHLIVVGDSDDELSRFYDRPEPEHLGDRIAETVSPSNAIPAAAVDLEAGHRDTNLARLQNNNAPEDAIEFARSFHARHITAQPPSQLTDQLPPPVDVPHIANSYTSAIVDASLYKQTYMPYPDRTVPYGDFLGSRPESTDSNGRQVEAYDRALTGLTNSATTTALRHIYRHDPAVPEWVHDHVTALADAAKLTARFDPDAFTRWVHAADSHQRDYGLLPTSRAPDSLTNPVARAQHNRLVNAHESALRPPSEATLTIGTTDLTAAPRPPRPRTLRL